MKELNPVSYSENTVIDRKNSFIQKGRISLTVLLCSATAVSAGSCVEPAEANQASNRITTIIHTTENTSQEASSNIVESITPNTTESKITPGATTTKPTTTETPTPTPTIELTRDQKNLSKYESELIESKPELKQFSANMLNLFDNAVQGEDPLFGLIEKYISREEIIKYSQTGEDSRVVKDTDGTPALYLLGWSKNSANMVRQSIKYLQKYDKNVLDVLNDNGTFAFMLNHTDAFNDECFGFNKEGLTVWNATEADIKKYNSNYCARPLIVENIGTAMLNLGDEYAEIRGFIKEEICGDIYKNLYNKTGEKDFLSQSNGSYRFVTKGYYANFYLPRKIDDTDVQELIKSVYDQKMIRFYGGSAKEIAKTARYHSILK